jgi:thioredoxin-like negative regulator of GroEL
MDELNQGEWTDFIVEHHIVIAMFYKDGVKECKKMEDLLEKKFKPNLKDFPDTVMIKVNIETNGELCEGMGISEAPVLMLFHHAEAVTHLLKNLNSQHVKVNQIVHAYKNLPDDLLGLISDLHREANQ